MCRTWHLPRGLCCWTEFLRYWTPKSPNAAWTDDPVGAGLSDRPRCWSSDKKYPGLAWKIRGAINGSNGSISETRAPRQTRVCTHLKCLWFCNSHVHKLTWLKIVQNIQSMREGVTAFLKKEGLDFIYLKSHPNLEHFPQENPPPRAPPLQNGWGVSALLHIWDISEWVGRCKRAASDPRPRMSSQALRGHTLKGLERSCSVCACCCGVVVVFCAVNSHMAPDSGQRPRV